MPPLPAADPFTNTNTTTTTTAADTPQRHRITSSMSSANLPAQTPRTQRTQIMNFQSPSRMSGTSTTSLSPWRIRVMVEAEREDEDADSIMGGMEPFTDNRSIMSLAMPMNFDFGMDGAADDSDDAYRPNGRRGTPAVAARQTRTRAAKTTTTTTKIPLKGLSSPEDAEPEEEATRRPAKRRKQTPARKTPARKTPAKKTPAKSQGRGATNAGRTPAAKKTGRGKNDANFEVQIPMTVEKEITEPVVQETARARRARARTASVVPTLASTRTRRATASIASRMTTPAPEPPRMAPVDKGKDTSIISPGGSQLGSSTPVDKGKDTSIISPGGSQLGSSKSLKRKADDTDFDAITNKSPNIDLSYIEDFAMDSDDEDLPNFLEDGALTDAEEEEDERERMAAELTYIEPSTSHSFKSNKQQDAVADEEEEDEQVPTTDNIEDTIVVRSREYDSFNGLPINGGSDEGEHQEADFTFGPDGNNYTPKQKENGLGAASQSPRPALDEIKPPPFYGSSPPVASGSNGSRSQPKRSQNFSVVIETRPKQTPSFPDTTQEIEGITPPPVHKRRTSASRTTPNLSKVRDASSLLSDAVEIPEDVQMQDVSFGAPMAEEDNQDGNQEIALAVIQQAGSSDSSGTFSGGEPTPRRYSGSESPNLTFSTLDPIGLLSPPTSHKYSNTPRSSPPPAPSSALRLSNDSGSARSDRDKSVHFAEGSPEMSIMTPQDSFDLEVAQLPDFGDTTMLEQDWEEERRANSEKALSTGSMSSNSSHHWDTTSVMEQRWAEERREVARKANEVGVINIDDTEDGDYMQEEAMDTDDEAEEIIRGQLNTTLVKSGSVHSSFTSRQEEASRSPTPEIVAAARVDTPAQSPQTADRESTLSHTVSPAIANESTRAATPVASVPVFTDQEPTASSSKTPVNSSPASLKRKRSPTPPRTPTTTRPEWTDSHFHHLEKCLTSSSTIPAATQRMPAILLISLQSPNYPRPKDRELLRKMKTYEPWRVKQDEMGEWISLSQKEGAGIDRFVKREKHLSGVEWDREEVMRRVAAMVSADVMRRAREDEESLKRQKEQMERWDEEEEEL